MTPEQRRSLEEIEEATQSLIHDLWLMALSLDVILCECREMRGPSVTPFPRPGP